MLIEKNLNIYKNKWHAFIGIALLSFGCYLDYTVVNVALPTIQQELHANLVSSQWVMNIYFLALCVCATTMGRLGDLYGRRLCLYIGAGIFLAASLLAGFSQNIELLILGRLLQGIGASIIFPLGLSLLPQLFPENERGKAIAWFGSIGGIALACGPLLGGLIVTYWGWRWIFFINIPIGIFGFLFCLKSVTESLSKAKNLSFDIKGMFLLAVTMAGIVLGLIYSQSFGWTAAITLGSFLTAIIFSVFLYKVEKNHDNPLIDFKDYANTLYLSGASLCFLAGFLSAVTLFFDPLYLQIIRGQSAGVSGFVLFAIPLSVFLMAFFVEKIINRKGLINTIQLGLSLACIAALLHIFFTSNCSLFYIVFTFICLGCAWALGNTVSVIAAQKAVGPDRASVATGSLVTLFNIGGSLGLTLAVVVYNFVTSYSLSNIHPTQINQLKDFIANPTHSLQVDEVDVIHQLFNTIFMNGFTGIMSYLLLCSIVIFCVVWRRRSNDMYST